MPFYHKIDPDTKHGKRTLENLLQLRKALKKQIPPRTAEETLLLATWNIRDFDKASYGFRTDEAIYYLAEIISRFDLVAIQEVYKDLTALDRLVSILGKSWEYLVTDTTAGTRGNSERMAYLYDGQKVSLGGLAGELVLPPVKVTGGETVPADQVWRTPYICAFRSGWSKFVLCSVHILWGKGSSRSEPKNRIQEIRKVAQFLAKRTKDDTSWSKNLILLGDFNIFDTKGEAFNELVAAGFEIPEKMRDFTTNIPGTKQYDQIAFRKQKERLSWTEKCGVFKFFDYVFKDDQEDIYIADMQEAYYTTSKGKKRTRRGQKSHYKIWRTHQMSDHLPLWVELKIDFSDQYLQRKLGIM